jgi:hypothetical protein
MISIKIVFLAIAVLGTMSLISCSATRNSAALTGDDATHNVALLHYVRGY